ncbi:hypothetical protein CYLTODRAFT_416120 [Cylindrobasidium torrendii FP15055 ss-10]|uniref:Sacsin/Nov domain-containing protein n=1 Tax=Cylindrobasidium torrendii FP15055 ss-10 TaxID=1314674 RepID=A0A0D7BXA7_9AGAR|nr:hypothetical protein CYLTODRAFT_416120 [Cylindrobasidium torrendii FP15055 ss-10]
MDRDAIWAGGQDEQVTVNQRALISKILSRYSTQLAVFRELLQNSDDAQATEAEIHYVPTAEGKILLEKATTLDDLQSIEVEQWIIRNNGMTFREQDWNRLKKIADGNPEADKIGAFGVGFYSVFDVTEAPIVRSGDQWMGFYFKDNNDQLFARRGALPESEGQWTSVDLKLKDVNYSRDALRGHGLHDLARFLSSSITFMRTMSQVSVFVDGRRLIRIQKASPEPPMKVTIPKHITRTTPQGVMTIKSVEQSSLLINAEIAKWVLASAPKPVALLSPQGMLSKFTGIMSRPWGQKAQTPEPPAPTPVDINAVEQMSVVLDLYSADLTSKLSSRQKAEVHSAMQKDPPTQLKLELVYTGKAGHDAGQLASDQVKGVFKGLYADLDGSDSAHIFIGHATENATGIGGHISSRFIPTVERTKVDINNHTVTAWNYELLRAGGILSRIVHDLEYADIKRLWDVDPAARAELTQRAIHVMKFFAFWRYQDASRVTQWLREGFFKCNAANASFPIMTAQGVRTLADARRPNAAVTAFLPNIPVVSKEVDDKQSELLLYTYLLAGMADGLFVQPIRRDDIVRELQAAPLSEDDTVTALKWLIEQKEEPQRMRAAVLPHMLLFLPASEDTPERIITLSEIRTFVDPRRFPTQGPLPPHVLPASVSKRLKTAALTTCFGWQELSLLQWVQHIVSPKTRTGDAEHDLEASPVWAEQVLNTIAKGWAGISTPVAREQIKAALKDLKCIPTNSGMHIPDDTYFPGTNFFPDLPVVTFASGTSMKVGTALREALGYLGVRSEVQLQTLFNKVIKTGQWDIFDLLKYLASRTLEPDELARLRVTAVFPKEEGQNPDVPPKKYRANELYEPVEDLRKLGLPILGWNSKKRWTSTSSEAKIAFALGLRQSPPVETLIQLCAQKADPKTQRAAWDYLVKNVAVKYGGPAKFDIGQFYQIPFIPAKRGEEKCLGTPAEVFSNEEWKAFGFMVVDESVGKDACAQLGIPASPSAEKMVAYLRNNHPADEAQAKIWFEILGSHIREYKSEHLKRLSAIEMVPVKGSGAKGLIWKQPNECYFRQGKAASAYSTMFSFVDFGPGANSFLGACGTRQEPTPDEIAQMLLMDPQKFYDAVGGSVGYVAELQRIALGYQQVSMGTKQRMQRARFLLAYRRKPKVRTVGEKEKLEVVDDEEMDMEYALKMAHEIVIADDLNALQIFGDKIFSAPQEDILEAFYMNLGSRKLSTHVEETCTSSAEMLGNRKTADIRRLILERLPIFLHEHTHTKPKITFNYLNNDKHFVVRTFGKLQMTKTFTIGATRIAHTEETTAFSPRVTGGVLSLFLAGNIPLDMYEVALALVRQLFDSPKTNDALLFMTILSTDLQALKRRGYNVDRILRKQHDERMAAAAAAAKSAIQPAPPPPPSSTRPPSKAIEPSPALSTPALPHEEPAMPGGFFGAAGPGIKNRLEGLKDKFMSGPGSYGQAEGSSSGSSTSSPLPPKPAQSRPTGQPATGASRSAISSNIDQAINACRPEKNHLLHNRQEMRMVKESLNDGYCDLTAHVGSLKQFGVIENIPIYLQNQTPVKEGEAFIANHRPSLLRFIQIMTVLSRVYGLTMSTMHVFWEAEGTTIAFNRNGSIFLNLRYYLMWHDEEVASGLTSNALISWYFTLAHEIAHNLVQPHNSEHEFYFSAICEKHLMSLGGLLRD